LECEGGCEKESGVQEVGGLEGLELERFGENWKFKKRNH